MAAKQKSRVTLQKLIQEGKEIWVKNLTGTVDHLPDAGPVVFQIGPDSPDSVVIPPGKDPVCITDQVDPESLKSCRDLFKLIYRHALELLDPEQAEEYYMHNVERKRKLEEKIRKYVTRAREDAKEDSPNVRESATATLNPKIAPLCLKAKHKSIEEEDMLEALMEQSGGFSEADYAYLASNGVFVSVKEWAKEALAEGADEDPVEKSFED